MDPEDEDCGDCDPCLFLTRRPEDPSSHCVNCKCLYCIPGA